MRAKKVIKVVVFCIILGIFLNRVYSILSWKDTSGEYYSSMESLYGLDKDVVDVLFLGSSRCYCSINNSVLWEEQGISSFSLAISGQDLASSYYCLVEALKTQTPEVVCLELYGATFHGYLVESNMYRNTLSFRLSENAVNAVTDIAEDRKEELLLKWPIVHTRYAELQKKDFDKDRPVYLGYHAEFNTTAVEPLCSYYGDERLAIAGEEETWIRKIIALAEENDIQLVFFAAPVVSSEEDQKMLNYVAAIGEEHGIPLINMPRMQEELQLNVDSDFINWSHTNYYGAQKVSAYMGRFLKEHYSLPDRRGDESYSLWCEDAKVRQHEYRNQMLKQTYDIREYLGQLAGIGEYTVILTTNGEFYSDAADIGDYVSELGMVDFYDTAGTWIRRDDQLLYHSTEANSFEYVELSEGDMVVQREDGNSSIVIDNLSYSKVQNGINIVVYDDVLGQVADAIGFDVPNQYMPVR